MEKHHEESIAKFLQIYSKDQNVDALILGGSIAHGFERPDSDIDILIIVNEEEFKQRKSNNKLAFSLGDICTYEHGYIDCKVNDIDYLKKVSEFGSDAARYAFKDTKILYSKINNLEELIVKIACFPINEKDERRKRFASQILAWKWYYSEGVKKENTYLLYLAIQKIILFSCRIVLNENELLYPFHKWMLKEVKKASSAPENFISQINNLLNHHSLDSVNNFCDNLFNFIGFTDKAVDWPNYFLKDSEQNWLEHEPPIDDI